MGHFLFDRSVTESSARAYEGGLRRPTMDALTLASTRDPISLAAARQSPRDIGKEREVVGGARGFLRYDDNDSWSSCGCKHVMLDDGICGLAR